MLTIEQLEEEIEQKKEENEKFAELVDHVREKYPEDEADSIILGAYVKTFRPGLAKSVQHDEED